MLTSTIGWAVLGPVAGLVFAVSSADSTTLMPQVHAAGHTPAAFVATAPLSSDWQSDPKRYESTRDDPELKGLAWQLFKKYGIWIIVVAIISYILSRKR